VSVVAGVGLLAGCAATPGPAAAVSPPAAEVAATTGADGVQRVTVTVSDALQYSPSTITARTGTLLVTFVADASPHTLGFETLGVETGNVNPRASTTITVHLDHAGTFEFDCDYHPSMTGALIVHG
jgi:plastocyanin